ncbi:MAG: hypothetical protein IJ833_02995 [Lachnospiraceae bacterium]|nr:hypothetical protein [Lachnospiraceae bacterium]
MSSNLLKWGYTNLQQEDVRVIDANAMLEKRLEIVGQKTEKPRPEGFVSGLVAEQIDVSELQDESEGTGEFSGNVIKSSEDAEQMLAQANEEAAAVLEQARQEADRLLQEAKAHAQQEREQVLAEARQQGYEDGSRQAEREVTAMKSKLQEKERELEAEYQKQIDELEPKFIEVITGIYEQIFHVELESYRDILVFLIAGTIRNVENSHEFIVHVSKEDYPFVSMQKKQLSATSTNSTVDVIEDLTLGKNECLIETESGIFDCGLGTQLEELTRRLKLLSYGK